MKVAGDPSIAGRIEHAFQKASSKTGTSFDFLLQAAARESSFDPKAKAKTSSASGLFQFIESTWLETLKKNGEELGLEDYSAHIRVDAKGKYQVDNAHLRKQLLDLRYDPEVSSLVAGALAKDNASGLSNSLGREPSEGELYLAHFLGVTGSLRLLNAVQDAPQKKAADLFPLQARSNKAVFYNREGQARGVLDVHERLVGRFNDTIAKLDKATAGHHQDPITKPIDSHRVESRILTAWRATTATDSEIPFQSLFRTNETAAVTASKAVSATKQSGFEAQESMSQQFAAPRPIARPSGGPLDLTKFLSPQQESGKSISKKV
ncbi:Transglycosylase SLT domain protein [Pseudovibrio axinellae]|uniref:Transglycosylase SLT domain protein n=1 Tax=Pseudovibrio axinellae TaxID=989403 RepID=A0A161VAY1_9HYPH|nr:transglycosylase SLT domain-containing protein [Pseudovibrio axinellae]KZL21234.1 Transglycosylase SLT domain protein [Pseudovibrio axinellae]SEQ92935.1 Transglycosylase SLT domain-containing protein [Pseudovibrio axinellae]